MTRLQSFAGLRLVVGVIDWRDPAIVLASRAVERLRRLAVAASFRGLHRDVRRVARSPDYGLVR